MGAELKELADELCKAAELVKKEVAKIVKKEDLTPNELESLYKAACLVEKLEMVCGGDDYMDDYSSGYYPHMSWGNSYGGNSYGEPMNYSGRRGRSSVTGRFVSRGGMEGYSGHSIEDRMVASLEQQMDAAKTDYERQMIQKEIEHIRMGTR